MGVHDFYCEQPERVSKMHKKCFYFPIKKTQENTVLALNWLNLLYFNNMHTTPICHSDNIWIIML